MKNFILSLISATVLASCASNSFEITGKSFYLTELNGTEMPVFNEDNPPMIIFDKDRVNATVGCNSIFAVYHTDKKGNITISESGSTKMYCPEKNREDEFCKAFSSIVGYTITGDIICFKDNGGKIILKGRLER